MFVYLRALLTEKYFPEFGRSKCSLAPISYAYGPLILKARGLGTFGTSNGVQEMSNYIR